jgi:hypothetical protein
VLYFPSRPLAGEESGLIPDKEKLWIDFSAAAGSPSVASSGGLLGFYIVTLLK